MTSLHNAVILSLISA